MAGELYTTHLFEEPSLQMKFMKTIDLQVTF